MKSERPSSPRRCAAFLLVRVRAANTAQARCSEAALLLARRVSRFVQHNARDHRLAQLHVSCSHVAAVRRHDGCRSS